MENQVLYLERRLIEFWEFMDNGVYPFMAFACLCCAAIAWILSSKRKPPPPLPSSPQTRAIVGIMLTSPGMSSDADGGRTRLIIGDVPSQRSRASDSGCL